MSEKRKVTNSSLFGALFSNAAKRGIQAIELGDDAPPELRKFVEDVQEAVSEDLEGEAQVTVISENPTQTAPIETAGEEVK